MSISAAENAGPGPGDLQDPLWVKMSAITGNNTKKRKKSDAKPQSQISSNKCLNEKRRRTLENTFIDEIEELITATDMSSGKTDKCQILQRAVDKIRHICEQEGSNSHAVQQGEVSSSNPNILSNDQVGPIVLEALDGFLFVVSAEGRIEYVTDNIKQYINYSKDDVFGKDIYNIIHHGDHQAFVESLPMLLGWTCDPQPQTRKGSFNCRFLVKPDDKDETMEQKQQRVSQYETMQICSALLPINTNRLESGDVSSESSDIGPCVMCVARRISSNEKPVGATIEQFSVKSDISGKIIAVDNNGLSTSYSKYLNEDLVGTTIQDLCHPHDLSKLTAHLKGTTQTGEGTSSMYRLRMCSDKFLNVQTKSRLFKGNGMNESDFVMSAYSIVGPLQESQSGMSNTSVPIVNANGANPAGAAVLPGSSGPSSVPGPPNPTGNGLPGTSTSASNSIIPGNNIVGPSTSKRHEDNKNSNNSSTPMNIHGNVSHDVNNPTSHSSQACHETQNSVVPTESGRLRNLLTKRTSVSDDNQDTSNNDNDNQNEHRILKILLNQPDEDDYHSEHSNKLRTSPSNLNKSNVEHPKPSLGNNMLLQLLNEKNDEDEDARAGLKKQHELLQQLLKDPDEERKMQEQRESRDDDPLLRSLGFRAATPSPSQSGDHPHPATSQVGQKRPGEDGNMNMAVKRPMDGSHQVSSSGTGASSTVTSKLWEKNKMLASLLAKQPSQPATIPPIPASVISATPQDKLPRVVDRLKQQQPWSGGSMQPIVSNATTTTATSARTPLQNQTRQLPRQATYLNHMLSQQQRPQMGQMDTEFSGSGDYRPAGMDPNSWDNQSSDPDLSDILDQVIEFVPDEAIAGLASRLTESSAIANLLDAIESPPMNEKMAINAIQKSLMLCETAVNPTSSTITMPGTPPAYSTALGNTSVTTSHNYQPPPMYQQQSRVRFNAQPGIRQNAAQFTQHQQQRAKLLQQQQQQQQQQLKQRLLQQQQQQQLLIPSNATAPDQIASGIHNIDSLLNNTVAPNVSLQRSNVPDSQVSPGYGGSVQMPSGHRLSHSYSHPATLPQHPVVNNNFNSGQQVSAAAARLSPHSPAAMMSFSHPQPLSPRVSQGNYGNSPRMFNVNQTRQQQPAQQQLQQQQRSMPSPGTPASARQSPFPAESFPPPASPTASQFPPVPNPNAANPTAQYRLQRASSTPTATTQLPGGIGSPRHYGGGVNKDQPLLSPSHQHGGCQPTANHNQQNPANSQHYTNQQHTSMLYHTSANSINNHDVQNNQFCYDRTSISMYGTGPGDPQDARSMPPSNTTGHQMGGNTSSTGSMTSEFVRQELRAVVGARTQQRVPNNLQNNLTGQVTQDDLEALGLPFEMSSAGEAVVSDGPAKSWAIGSAGSAPSSSRTTMEEAVRGDPKSSLLQKLLSE
ncbi:nuclear receptor coactivator 2-like isoform X9 [Venturia canescens]|uniref:nuclear receptor coactivator 2-like isoform X9 n=1 Tax=Venturia canescens TaxID=32260 RepID=UPI001C9CF851|nr:nuclear receptor coactivator 2-like isoform X9 [Venturia canescens]